jgi:hypothetical protein
MWDTGCKRKTALALKDVLEELRRGVRFSEIATCDQARLKQAAWKDVSEREAVYQLPKLLCCVS